MARVYLVRHGRATAGWDTDADPGLDAVGEAQARRVADRLDAVVGGRPLPILVSPMRRCRETAAPLAARWGVEPEIDAAVGEIPSPPGVEMGARVEWLRAAMVRRWSDLGPAYSAFRDGVVARVAALAADTVVVSHFVAINAVIGACQGDDRVVLRSLDNASVTIVESDVGGLTLIEGGHEADTLIR